MKYAKSLRTPVFTEQLQRLLLTFNSYFQISPVKKPVRVSVKNTKFNWKKYLLPRRSRRSRRKISRKRLQLCEIFEIAIILKIIGEQLLLKTSTSMTNLPKGGNFWSFYRFKPFNILNILLWRNGFFMKHVFRRFLCYFFSHSNMIFLSKKSWT